MRWFNANSTVISASGNASRRDVVVMMVLDRSGSMQNAGACSAMMTAAKLFTGQFAAGRDQLGLVSFSDNVYIHSAPTTNFQAVLGYKNNLGSGTGALDTITCAGGTSTAQAISVAYNEVYKMNLPGALNVIMFETDGLPNTLTLNFWDSSASVAGIRSTSNCTDKNTKKISAGGFASASVLRRVDRGPGAGKRELLFPTSRPASSSGSTREDPGGTNKYRHDEVLDHDHRQQFQQHLQCQHHRSRLRVRRSARRRRFRPPTSPGFRSRTSGATS